MRHIKFNDYMLYLYSIIKLMTDIENVHEQNSTKAPWDNTARQFFNILLETIPEESLDNEGKLATIQMSPLSDSISNTAITIQNEDCTPLVQSNGIYPIHIFKFSIYCPRGSNEICATVYATNATFGSYCDDLHDLLESILKNTKSSSAKFSSLYNTKNNHYEKLINIAIKRYSLPMQEVIQKLVTQFLILSATSKKQ